MNEETTEGASTKEPETTQNEALNNSPRSASELLDKVARAVGSVVSGAVIVEHERVRANGSLQFTMTVPCTGVQPTVPPAVWVVLIDDEQLPAQLLYCHTKHQCLDLHTAFPVCDFVSMTLDTDKDLTITVAPSGALVCVKSSPFRIPPSDSLLRRLWNRSRWFDNKNEALEFIKTCFSARCPDVIE